MLKWIVASLLAICFILTVMAWFVLPFGPVMDDGPFDGTPTRSIEGRVPDQRTPIWGGATLEVFDATTPNASATVQLRLASGEVKWAVLADGHRAGDARSIRFSGADRGIFRSGVVRGTVDWSFGKESCNWYITGSGTLRNYYYSW